VASQGEGKLVDRIVFPVIEDRAAGQTSGVAIFNGDLNGVKLTLTSPPGNVEGTEQVIDIPAGGHRIVFVGDVFPDFIDFRGSLLLEAGHARSHENSQLAAVGIHRVRGQITTFPGLLTAADRPVQPQVVFAGFTSGGDAPSTLFLDPTFAGRLEFFDQAGSPWAVAINGQAPAATVPFAVGTGVFTTPAAGPPQTGSVRVTTTEAATSGGIHRLARAGGGIASAGPSPELAAFIAPVFRNIQNNRTTEVALASTGSAVRLALELRDSSGSSVPGGVAQLPLPANGQIVRTINALFPGANTDNFRGTLTVRAEGGPVAASVLDVGGDPAATAVMPVVPLR
jgi:hypothetical protein